MLALDREHGVVHNLRPRRVMPSALKGTGFCSQQVKPALAVITIAVPTPNPPRHDAPANSAPATPSATAPESH